MALVPFPNRPWHGRRGVLRGNLRRRSWCSERAGAGRRPGREVPRPRLDSPLKIPKNEGVAVGFWEAGRGWLVHHMLMDKGKLTNYKITTPSTMNASPTDPFRGLGR